MQRRVGLGRKVNRRRGAGRSGSGRLVWLHHRKVLERGGAKNRTVALSLRRNPILALIELAHEIWEA